MADEISQVVEMEFKGTYYLLKGTKAAVALMIKGLKALENRANDIRLNRPGECSWNKIQEVSNGTPIELEFPREMFTEKVVGIGPRGQEILKSDFDIYCEKYGLRYTVLPDLNPYDDYIPVAVPAQDVGIHKEMIKVVMNRRIATEEQKEETLDEKILAAKERILNATSPEEKEEAEKDLAMLHDAKTENADLLQESKEKAARENELDFVEYLKQGDGSLFEKDPEKALEMESVCGIVREYKPSECMMPVRDEGHIPESGVVYYGQFTDDGKMHVIKRVFEMDEVGHYYSEYRVKGLEKAEVKTFSDLGHDRETWAKQLPEMLQEAGFIEDGKTAVVQSEENFKKYEEYVEANFKKASEGEKPAEAKEQKQAENVQASRSVRRSR